MIPLENRSAAMFLVRETRKILRDVATDNIIECDIDKIVEARDTLNRALKLLGQASTLLKPGETWVGETRPDPSVLAEVMQVEKS
jgi:hypothetical protein